MFRKNYDFWFNLTQLVTFGSEAAPFITPLKYSNDFFKGENLKVTHTKKTMLNHSPIYSQEK